VGKIRFKKTIQYINRLVIAGLSLIMILLFQNCGQGLKSVQDERTAAELAADIPGACVFDGEVVMDGESVTAYVEGGAINCVSEVRTCHNRELSGSYEFGSCKEHAPRACLFDGKTIQHGESAVAYAESSVPFGSQCNAEVRHCDDGVLAGAAPFSTCTVDGPKACLFNGQTIAHGVSVTGYPVSNPAYGTSCNPETRVCNNGVLSGSAAFGSCTPGLPAACMFNGKTVAHGGVVSAYTSPTVPYTGSCTTVLQTRTCNNGTLSGTATNATCMNDAPRSCTYGRLTLKHQEYTTIGFYVGTGQGNWPWWGFTDTHCSANIRLCNDGQMWKAQIDVAPASGEKWCVNTLISGVSNGTLKNVSYYGKTDNSGSDLYPNEFWHWSYTPASLWMTGY
jgi:hypothetical protein